TLLAQDTQSCAHLDLHARAYRLIDGVEMAITIIPTAVIEYINDIITRLYRRILMTGQHILSCGNHRPRRGGDHVDHSLAASEIEVVMIVNRAAPWNLAA